MKMVLAFEGMDGSGKTSLALFTRKLCEQQNQRYTMIGRRESYSSPLVGRLTGLLHEEAANLVPSADIAVRIAREYQRAALAAAVPSGIIVLDRFVMSLLSLAPDLQEQVLFLPRTERGRDTIQMRHLLPIAQVPDWKIQRQLWGALTSRGREESPAAQGALTLRDAEWTLVHRDVH